MFQLTLTALASGEHSAPANRTTPTQRVLLGFHVPDLSIPSFLLENNPITLVGSVRFPSLPFLLLFALAARHSFAFGCLSLLCNTHTRYRYHRLSFLCIPIQEPGNRLEVPAAEERIHSFIHSFIHPPSRLPVCQEYPSLDRQLISARHTRTVKRTNALTSTKKPPSELQVKGCTSSTQSLISRTARISNEVCNHFLCRCGAPLWIRGGFLAHALPL
jgi:hypothetical protein